jgi:hypothetical protein
MNSNDFLKVILLYILLLKYSRLMASTCLCVCVCVSVRPSVMTS